MYQEQKKCVSSGCQENFSSDKATAMIKIENVDDEIIASKPPQSPTKGHSANANSKS